MTVILALSCHYYLDACGEFPKYVRIRDCKFGGDEPRLVTDEDAAQTPG